MKILATIFGVLGLFILIAMAKGIGKSAGKSAVNKYNQVHTNGAVEEALLDTSKKVNQQLPMMVDSETRLDSTMCLGKQMFYRYTMVNLSVNEIDKVQFKNSISQVLIGNQCNNDNMLKLLKVDVKYSYIYCDKNGNEIATITIDRGNCGI